jgi:phosphate transport system protein
MPRGVFERDMQRLQDDVIALSSQVEAVLVQSVECLKAQDREQAQRMIAADRTLNEKRFAIQSDTLVLIATQQPMARDLRVLAAILDIASELERIADYAKGIAKINLLIGDEPLIKPLIDLPRMADKASDMLHRAMEAFTRQDAQEARAIALEDDEVDGLYNQIYRELLTLMLSNPRTIDQATYLLWAAHNLERAADRVVNICERVVFTVTGEFLEMDGDEGQASRVESLH